MKVLLILLAVSIMPALAQVEFYDPMQPPAYALRKMKQEMRKKSPSTVKTAIRQKDRKPRWLLSSILYSPARQHAIINGRLVKQGDVVNGAKLIMVGKDRVRLKKKGKLIELKLEPGVAIRIKSRIKTAREKTL